MKTIRKNTLTFRPRITQSSVTVIQKKLIVFAPKVFSLYNRYFFSVIDLLRLFSKDLFFQKINFLWTLFLLKKTLLSVFDPSRVCFVSTNNIYRAATKDIAIALKSSYSTGEVRGTFSNQLKNSSLNKNCPTPFFFFLLNSAGSYNFLQELHVQNKNVKILSIFSFNSSNIPFTSANQTLLMLQQQETIYKVFLYSYIISALRSHKL